MYCVPQLDPSIHAADLIPPFDLYDPSIPELSSPEVKLDCSISNLSLKLRCETSHLCWCTVFLKTVRVLVSDMSSSFAGSREVPEGSGGKSIPVATIFKCLDVMLVRIILNT